MTEAEFTRATDAALERIAEALEEAGVECECGFKGSGVLEVEFDRGGKLIVNRHQPAQEIWVAARSGGFHFRYDGTNWVDTRDGSELFARLSRIVGEQTGRAVTLGP